MTTDGNHDLVLVGAGPAGLSLAANACEAGLRTLLVDPAPRRRWTQRWSAFEDEVPGAPINRRWGTAEVHLPNRHIQWERPYVQLDSGALQDRLWERAQSADVVEAIVSGRTDDGIQSSIGTLRGTHVVDCSGAKQVLGSNGPAAKSFQRAIGWEIETNGHPWQPHVATWMDFRDLNAEMPSFLYAMPISDTRVFVEETSLAARPGMPLEHLEERLELRLARLGVEVREVVDAERCHIALDVPEPTQLAFGTAAGMVHPSTGYLLARTLHHAPGFISDLAKNEPRAAMQRIRSPARSLHLLGLNVLTRCSGTELAAFFDAYFAQPRWVNEAFVARDPSLPATTFAMLRLFGRSPLPVKRLLVRPFLAAHPSESP